MLDCFWKEAHHFSRVVLFSSNTAPAMYYSAIKKSLWCFAFSLSYTFFPLCGPCLSHLMGKEPNRYDERKNFGLRPNIPCMFCMIRSVGTWPRGWQMIRYTSLVCGSVSWNMNNRSTPYFSTERRKRAWPEVEFKNEQLGWGFWA